MSEAIERRGAALDLNAAEVRAADRAARTWEAGESGPIVLGSEAHKRAFCRMLLDTHNPYRPSIVDWPALDPEARDRLVSLPIWDIAMQTEGNASLRVLSLWQHNRRPAVAGSNRNRWFRGDATQAGSV